MEASPLRRVHPLGLPSPRIAPARGCDVLFADGAAHGAHRPSVEYSQAQLDMLFDLALAHPSMRKELMEELELARERSEREGELSRR